MKKIPRAERLKIKMDRQAIYKQISNNVEEAKRLLREAQKLADETGISFSWEFERDMNGTYTAKVPKGLRDKIRGKTIKEIENMGLWPITTEYIHEWDARYEEEYTSYGLLEAVNENLLLNLE